MRQLSRQNLQACVAGSDDCLTWTPLPHAANHLGRQYLNKVTYVHLTTTGPRSGHTPIIACTFNHLLVVCCPATNARLDPDSRVVNAGKREIVAKPAHSADSSTLSMPLNGPDFQPSSISRLDEYHAPYLSTPRVIPIDSHDPLGGHWIARACLSSCQAFHSSFSSTPFTISCYPSTRQPGINNIQALHHLSTALCDRRSH